MKEKRVGNGVVRVVSGEITDLDVDAIVFYARPNKQLGSGYGGMISGRGGGSIQEELRLLDGIDVGQASVTGAGKLKAKWVIHAFGPAFQEPDTETKLRKAVESALDQAAQKGAQKIAFPPMGVGFYGVPRDLSARVTLDTLKAYLSKETSLREVFICVRDPWETKPFQSRLDALS